MIWLLYQTFIHFLAYTSTCIYMHDVRIAAVLLFLLYTFFCKRFTTRKLHTSIHVFMYMQYENKFISVFTRPLHAIFLSSYCMKVKAGLAPYWWLIEVSHAAWSVNFIFCDIYCPVSIYRRHTLNSSAFEFVFFCCHNQKLVSSLHFLDIH
jgi:hypothetical protein